MCICTCMHSSIHVNIHMHHMVLWYLSVFLFIWYTDILFIHTASSIHHRRNSSATLEVTILKASTQSLSPA
jgi:hypothetical protein